MELLSAAAARLWETPDRREKTMASPVSSLSAIGVRCVVRERGTWRRQLSR